MIINFHIKGEPMGLERTKFARAGQYGHVYTPARSQNYKKLVAASYKASIPVKDRYIENDGPLYRGPVKVTIWAFYKIPKSTSKKAAADMRSNKVKPLKKPDLDNVIKIILDGLNGVAYEDDKQVVQITAYKVYETLEPEVIVEVGPLC